MREKPVSFGKPLVNLKSGESFGDVYRAGQSWLGWGWRFLKESLKKTGQL